MFQYAKWKSINSPLLNPGWRLLLVPRRARLCDADLCADDADLSFSETA
jgi:hypothetical protein